MQLKINLMQTVDEEINKKTQEKEILSFLRNIISNRDRWSNDELPAMQESLNWLENKLNKLNQSIDLLHGNKILIKKRIQFLNIALYFFAGVNLLLLLSNIPFNESLLAYTAIVFVFLISSWRVNPTFSLNRMALSIFFPFLGLIIVCAFATSYEFIRNHSAAITLFGVFYAILFPIFGANPHQNIR